MPRIGSPFFIALLVAAVSASSCPSGSQYCDTHTSPSSSRLARRATLVARDQSAVVDSTYMTYEVQIILNKYANASRYLEGVGLAPMPNFTTYAGMQTSNAASVEENITDNSYNSSVSLPVATAAGTAVLPLTDDISGSYDIEYYGPLNIGTAAQSLTVDIDTGSADLWVPSNCGSCPNKQFNEGGSSTFHNTGKSFQVTYGSGSVSGALVQDNVNVQSLTVKNQYFGAVNNEQGTFQSAPSSGLIGMAFSSIASSGKPTFFENLMTQRSVASPMFSVHLARHQATGSEVCFGCYDNSKTTGGPIFVPVVSETYWTVNMDGLYVNKSSGVQTSIYAAIDTGTTFIYVPGTVASKFYGMVPGAQPASQIGNGFYTFPCSSKLSPAFSFNGNHFTVDTRDFNLGKVSANSDQCVGGIIGMSGSFPSNLAIIGDEFLKSWYSTFDYSSGVRVGFSPDINNRG